MNFEWSVETMWLMLMLAGIVLVLHLLLQGNFGFMVS